MQSNRQRVNPRVVALEQESRLTNKVLSKREHDLVRSALQDSGVFRAYERFSDDCQRLAIGELIKVI